MSDWAPKVFWKDVAVAAPAPGEMGFGITLDGRPVRTPSKARLAVPTQAAAEVIAAEWRAQKDKIDPATMPATRTANSAIDKVAFSMIEVAAMLSDYGQTDLLCYRAAHPQQLVELQNQGWDPLLDWAAERFGARLVKVKGVMPAPQDGVALDALRAEVEALDAFRLSAFHDLVALSGSLVLALAVVEERLSPEEAWTLSRVDEDFQISQWGADEEASADASRKKAAFVDAARFFTALTGKE